MSAGRVAARMQGDDFQTRYFWLRALELVTSDFVERVELESTLVDVVDDVVVYYKGPVKRDIDGFYEIDACQLKYHVSQAGAFSCAALLDSDFSHTKQPLLSRLYGAYLKLKPGGKAFRLRVISPWGWDQADPLAGCLSPEGHFRAEFFDCGPGTDIGKKRTLLAGKLGVGEAEVREFFRTVRFEIGSRSLHSLNEHLCDRLRLASVRPLPPGQLHSPYDDLARKFLGQGLTSFTAPSLTAELEQEGFFVAPVSRRGQVTLRSRPQWARKPLETQSAHLDLCPLFAERFPRHKDVWNQEVPTELRGFITPERLGDLPQPIELFFDCHLSIAFAAGSLLSAKSGLRLAPVQKVTGRGYQVWDCPPEALRGLWAPVEPLPPAAEVIVALSITHDLRVQVAEYAVHAGLNEFPLLTLTPLSSVGPLAVADAGQAWSLGTEFPALLRAALPKECRQIHLFYAGPAALAFIIGAHLGGLPPIQLYEYDFEGGTKQERYFPSLALPLPVANDARA